AAALVALPSQSRGWPARSAAIAAFRLPVPRGTFASSWPMARSILGCRISTRMYLTSILRLLGESRRTTMVSITSYQGMGPRSEPEDIALQVHRGWLYPVDL